MPKSREGETMYKTKEPVATTVLIKGDPGLGQTAEKKFNTISARLSQIANRKNISSGVTQKALSDV